MAGFPVSRNQKDLGGKLPEVKDSIAALEVQDAIIDGEIFFVVLLPDGTVVEPSGSRDP